MNVFVLVKKGMYIQAIMGVYSTRALALVDGWAAKEREPDDYHTFEIYEVPMGRLPNKSDLGDFNSFDVLTYKTIDGWLSDQFRRGVEHTQIGGIPVKLSESLKERLKDK